MEAVGEEEVGRKGRRRKLRYIIKRMQPRRDPRGVFLWPCHIGEIFNEIRQSGCWAGFRLTA